MMTEKHEAVPGTCMRRIYAAAAVVVLFLAAAVPKAAATETVARRTGQTCSLCHLSSQGGPLSPAGMAFIRNDYEYPVPKRVFEKSEKLAAPFHRVLRLILGYLHLAAAAILAGTIYYVHIMLKPSSLTSGIPRGEKRLGLASLAVLIVSGLYLTWYRIDSLSSFFSAISVFCCSSSLFSSFC